MHLLIFDCNLVCGGLHLELVSEVLGVDKKGRIQSTRFIQDVLAIRTRGDLNESLIVTLEDADILGTIILTVLHKLGQLNAHGVSRHITSSILSLRLDLLLSFSLPVRRFFVFLQH